MLFASSSAFYSSAICDTMWESVIESDTIELTIYHLYPGVSLGMRVYLVSLLMWIALTNYKSSITDL